MDQFCLECLESMSYVGLAMSFEHIAFAWVGNDLA